MKSTVETLAPMFGDEVAGLLGIRPAGERLSSKEPCFVILIQLGHPRKVSLLVQGTAFSKQGSGGSDNL